MLAYLWDPLSPVAMVDYLPLLIGAFFGHIGEMTCVAAMNGSQEWNRRMLAEKPLCWCWNPKWVWLALCDLYEDRADEVKCYLAVFEFALELQAVIAEVIPTAPWHFWAQLLCLYTVPPALLYISLSSPCKVSGGVSYSHTRSKSRSSSNSTFP